MGFHALFSAILFMKHHKSYLRAMTLRFFAIFQVNNDWFCHFRTFVKELEELKELEA